MKKSPLPSIPSLYVHSTCEFHFYRNRYNRIKLIINFQMKSKKQYKLA